VIERPLTVTDLFVNYKWREARWLGGPVKRRPQHYPVYALLTAFVGATRLLGLARGHAIMVVGRRPDGGVGEDAEDLGPPDRREA